MVQSVKKEATKETTFKSVKTTAKKQKTKIINLLPSGIKAGIAASLFVYEKGAEFVKKNEAQIIEFSKNVNNSNISVFRH